MKLVILAAGRGSRLQNLTDHIPKCMVEFLNKPIIEWQLERITKVIDPHNIAIVTGYQSEVLIDFIKPRYPEITFLQNENWHQTNMVSSLLCAQNWLDNNFIVTYSDIIYDAEIINQINIQQLNEITVPSNVGWKELWETRFDNPLDDLESFIIDSDMNLLEIGKKALSYDRIMGQFMGITYIPSNKWLIAKELILSKEAAQIAKLDFTSMLNELIILGMNIKTIEYKSFWLEIDSQDDIRNYINYQL